MILPFLWVAFWLPLTPSMDPKTLMPVFQSGQFLVSIADHLVETLTRHPFSRMEALWLRLVTACIREYSFNDGAAASLYDIFLFSSKAHGWIATSCFRSATTVLVLTLGSGVDGFTLDPDTGRFLHTHKDIRIPSAGPIYSFNEANFHDYEEPVQRYLDALKEGSSSVGIR